MTVSSVTINVPMEAGLSRLLAIVEKASIKLMVRGFTTSTLDRIIDGVDLEGEKLPASAHVAAVRLGLKPEHHTSAYVPSRVDRMVQASVASTLRTLADRDTALRNLTSTGELTKSHKKVRAGIAKNLVRQVEKHVKDHPKKKLASLRLPSLQSAPAMSGRLMLGAVDKQFATMTLDRSGEFLILNLRLPSSIRPSNRKGWVATEVCLPIPGHLRERDITQWHLPTVTAHFSKPDTASFHLSYTETDKPGRDPSTPITSVVGIDWSPATLGVISHTSTAPSGALVSRFEGHQYDDRGLGIKLSRLQKEGQVLSGKIARTGHLAQGLDESSALRVSLEAKIAVWKDLRTRLGAKRAMINRDMAFHFAGWVTDYTRQAGATSIAIEDLSTLQSGGIGKTNNNRVAQSARRKAVDATIHLGQRAGIEIVEVPARGTSANCPSCDQPLSRPGGYHTARCSPCGLAGNRDQVAAVNIGKRAIAGQSSLKIDRRTGRKRVREVSHAPVKRLSRDKKAPTPKRTRHRRVRNSTVVPVTMKTAKKFYPAPQASVWDTNKPSGTRGKPTPLLMPRCQGVIGIGRRFHSAPLNSSRASNR